MKLVKFNVRDIDAIVTLFYDTVHTVNAKDYSKDQLEAWAPHGKKSEKIAAWRDALDQNITYIAKINHQVVGFGDLTSKGYLDRLYVHKNYQGQGIASALMHQLEKEAKRMTLFKIETDASITAKPFFERSGYEVVRLQKIERNGIVLSNYKMIKALSPLSNE